MTSTLCQAGVPARQTGLWTWAGTGRCSRAATVFLSRNSVTCGFCSTHAKTAMEGFIEEEAGGGTCFTVFSRDRAIYRHYGKLPPYPGWGADGTEEAT